MRANIKLKLVVSVPVAGGNLEDALVAARQLKEKNIITFKPNVEYTDGEIKVLGVDSGEWVDE